MALFGHFGLFWPFLAKSPAFLEGFYINPSRRGPRNPFLGVLPGVAQKGLKRAILAYFPQNGEKGPF